MDARTESPIPDGWWPLLEKASLEKGALDQVDLALMHGLTAKAGRRGDPAFLAVLACLIAAVRAGGMRIPIESGSLAARLEEYLGRMARGSAAIGGADADGVTGALGAKAAAEGFAAAADPRAFAIRLATAFDKARTDGAYAAVLGVQGDYRPLIHAFDGLYFQKHHAAEISVGLRLKGLLTSPDLGAAPGTIDNILDTVLARYPLRLSAKADAPIMEFDPRQREALALALRKRFTVISGGPGTGKTSLAANLLRAWTRAWMSGGETAPRIRLAAPTGRAAQRLSESIRRSLESIRPPAPEGGADSRADRLIRDLACGTLHSLLRYNPGSGEYFHQAHRPLPADLVLLDEVSMVDIFTLARLLEALEPGACLVLLGDMDQLPSVDAGSVLADLIPHPESATGTTVFSGTSVSPSPPTGGSTAVPTAAKPLLADNLILLDRSHRSEADILDVTRRINAMDGAGALAAMKPPLVLEAKRTGEGAEAGSPWPIAFMEAGRRVCPEGGCRMLVSAAGPDWLESWIAFHYEHHSLDPARFPGRILAAPRRASYIDIVGELCALPSPEDPRRDALLEEIFAYLDQARILTLTRKGRYGAVSLNRRVRERLVRRWDSHAPPEGSGGFTGSPILILENDHAKGVFNGDVGIQVRIQGRDMIWFRRADAFQGFPAAFLPRHESAFAMTVHKSQGSEYDYVAVVLPEPGNRLLFKETLYTALTRARVFAGIQGPAETFLEAVARKVARESGLPDYLRHLLS